MWIKTYQQVYVVRHDLYRLDFDIVSFGKLIDSVFHVLDVLRRSEYRLTILRNPYNMVPKIVDIIAFVFNRM